MEAADNEDHRRTNERKGREKELSASSASREGARPDGKMSQSWHSRRKRSRW